MNDVSVVLPHYNAASTVGRALASVARQTCVPREVIIIDDASSDQQWSQLQEIARSFEACLNVRIHRLPFNLGAASARNAGWDLASSDYVAFLDADDSWHESKVERQLTSLLHHPEVVMTGHRMTETISEFGPRGPGYPVRQVNLPQLLLRNHFSTTGVMLKRTLPVRFPAGQRHSEDYALWLEIVAEGYRVTKCPWSLGRLHKARFGEGGLSSNMWRMSLAEGGNYWRLWRRQRIKSYQLILAYIGWLVRLVKRHLRHVLSKILRRRTVGVPAHIGPA